MWECSERICLWGGEKRNYKKQLTEQKKYIRIITERTYVLLRRILWQVKKN